MLKTKLTKSKIYYIRKLYLINFWLFNVIDNSNRIFKFKHTNTKVIRVYFFKKTTSIFNYYSLYKNCIKIYNNNNVINIYTFLIFQKFSAKLFFIFFYWHLSSLFYNYSYMYLNTLKWNNNLQIPLI